MMQTANISTAFLHDRSVFLIPNQAQISASGIGAFYKIVVIPWLLTGICFYHLLELRNSHLLIALGLVLLVLLNVHFFFIRHQTATNAFSMRIDLGEIQLLRNGQVLHIEELKNLRVSQLNWGKEAGDLLPVIRIEGNHFPKLFIASERVRNTWPNGREILEAADYRVASEREWQRLLQMLVECR